MREAGRNLDQVTQTISDLKQAAALFHFDPQVLAFNEFEGNKVETLVFTAEVDARDVLVVEFGGRACLMLESRDILRISGHVRRQDLQSDRASKLEILRLNDRGHTADADRFDEFKMTQFAANQTFGMLGIGARKFMARR